MSQINIKSLLIVLFLNFLVLLSSSDSTAQVDMIVNEELNTVEKEIVSEEPVAASPQVQKPKQKISVEVKTIQIALTEEHEEGVDWEAILSNYQNLTLEGGQTQEGALHKGFLSVGTITNEDYSVLVDALETVGELRVDAKSPVTTSNEEETSVVVEVRHSDDEAENDTETSHQKPLNVGVKLNVTPTLGAEKSFAMKLRSEVGSIVHRETLHGPAVIVIEKSKAQTMLATKEGETIVVGGLIKEEKTNTIRKIPVLGDIPVVGLVFRNQYRSVRRTELVIFLTPKIVEETPVKVDEKDDQGI